MKKLIWAESISVISAVLVFAISFHILHDIVPALSITDIVLAVIAIVAYKITGTVISTVAISIPVVAVLLLIIAAALAVPAIICNIIYFVAAAVIIIFFIPDAYCIDFKILSPDVTKLPLIFSMVIETVLIWIGLWLIIIL